MNVKEIYKAYPDSQQVVIFIHGIIEGPKQFRRLAEIAYEAGYSIYILLLPGHGGSGELFGITGYREWIRYTSWQIKIMKQKYKEVILVGHSMGALLALCEGASFPEQIRALVLLDTPLVIRVWPRVIKGAIKIAAGKGEVADAYTRAEYHAISVKQPTTWGYVRWAMRYIELLTLVRYARKQVPRIMKPTLVVFAMKDEFVSLKSRSYLRLHLTHVKVKKQFNEILLKDSGHFCYHHEDLLQLEIAFKHFMMKQKK